ncbi:hypothetical protein [Mariniflexile sp. AS56]|uniref:hypothetical protein n=1 Tax=Mariniflexile sp. AS56 TaxID=3063957 RepID=UPI0026F09323|nr:hypothetical protein [Mariniflexile sp. AS56]MDO7172591.1 hypothetical protein [Mariniflexile sp. AS56]
MNEFLLQNYLIITHSVEVIAALTGVFLLRNYRNGTTKYFIFFLVYLTICEFIAGYTRYVYPGKFLDILIGTIFQKNHWWATLFWKIGAIMFFSFYYRKILETKFFKDVIKYCSFIFLIISVSCIILNFEEFFYRFFPVISILGAVIVFLCTIFYFVETLQSDKILTFYKSINFYISAAIFIWWLIITPITFYDVYFVYEIGNPNRDWNFMFLRWQIYLFANVSMYLTFTFALIFCKPEAEIKIIPSDRIFSQKF